MLEWYRHSQRYAIGMGLAAFVVIGIGVGIRQGFDYSFLQYWWMWVILFVAALGMYSIFRAVDPAVGSDWLRVGRMWVLLYELKEIKVRHRGLSMHLDVKDSGNRILQVRVDHLQEDRDMWDLVYNGLMHSVLVNGANTNRGVHSRLKVPEPPE
ncbi:hypothetical protein GIY23_06480 [Allosaccharopolyspora coralli]|uniref:Uncharacterized protein n=1 Tax=Allosaccharopolyspora coralli TaxID=2665642 RepID=A0A5Q3Q719_9PSEU|nr:hypothetical protein [Allosaccharopolyspora coralli]QGK69226.1 hypothetical protein GIY23_06480 [Allosaccharopolyspora coralli]